MFDNSKFIWRTAEAKPDDYAEFVFTVTGDGRPKNLTITAGSDYNVFVGDRLVFFGQYPDYPAHRYYDSLPLGDFLADGENTVTVVVWYYGYKAAGDTALLKKLGRKLGFTVVEMAPVTVDGDVVSSTLIRGLIRSGDVDECEKYLGRLYSIGGEVVVGNRLGKTLGFPTSNITLDETMVTPPNGVYITYCIYNGVRYPSITNVGVKPTIGQFKKNMETHIFNFDKELYGKFIRIEFVKMTREEVKFSSKEELSAQIAKDCLDAKAYHGL